MGRSTFEGPVLAGPNRFAPFRNVGSVNLTQEIDLLLTNTTAGTSTYAGSSGVFAYGSNLTANVPGVVYAPSATAYPPVVVTPTTDTATNIYRGAVFYLPVGSDISDVIVDVGAATTVGGTLTAVNVLVGNAFNNGNYVPSFAITNTANTRQTIAYNTTNIQSTSADITNPPPGGQGTSPNSSLVSQVVFTIAITGTAMTGITAGSIFCTVRYTQYDDAVGNATNYPYGNLD